MRFIFALVALLGLSDIALAADPAPVAPEQPAAVAAPEAVTPAPAVLPAAGDALVVHEKVVAKPFLESLTDGTFLAKLIALLGALYVGLRGLAEMFTRISVYTENKWDNKVAKLLSDATWIVGAFLGKFGAGTPALVKQEIAAEAVEKAKAGGDAKPAA